MQRYGWKWSIAACAFFVLAGCQGDGVFPPAPPPIDGQACAPAPTIGGGATIAALQARAASKGRVRVIVEVAQRQGQAVGQTRGIAGAATAMRSLQSSAARVFRGAGVSFVEPLNARLPFVVAEMTQGQVAALYADQRFGVWIEDRIAKTTLDESAPLIQATDLTAAGGDGAGQAVAVLDTGVDGAHPFFGGRVVEEACFSTTSAVSGTTSLCPNGQAEEIGPGAAAPCDLPGCEHGTHVAGIAAGRGDALVGVAPEADIIAVQVFSRFTDPEVCGGAPECIASFTSDQIRGLDFVLQQAETRSVAAANMSLGGGRSATFCDSEFTKAVIDQLRDAGVATVVASGNDGFRNAVSFPACISSAVTVGATTNGDALAPFSNCGPQVDLHAPGAGIASSVPDARFATFSGTSMAAPHVAGALAALRSRTPEATVDAMERALKSTGVSVAGVPRINVLDASNALEAGPQLAQATVDAQLQNDLEPLADLPQDAPKRFIVRLKDAKAAASVSDEAQRAGAAYVGQMGRQPMLVIEATPKQIRDLATKGDVSGVQLDRSATTQ